MPPWASTSESSADNTRKNSSVKDFKTDYYYYDCKGSGKSKKGCEVGYNSYGYKSYGDLGYSCEVGNGKIPTKIDSNTGIITCATDLNGDCLVRKSKSDCEDSLNLIPIDKSDKNKTMDLVCENGKVDKKCINMYDNLELKTLNELGYNCNDSI